jgi:hypothetical protein
VCVALCCVACVCACTFVCVGVSRYVYACTHMCGVVWCGVAWFGAVSSCYGLRSQHAASYCVILHRVVLFLVVVPCCNIIISYHIIFCSTYFLSILSYTIIHITDVLYCPFIRAYLLVSIHGILTVLEAYLRRDEDDGLESETTDENKTNENRSTKSKCSVKKMGSSAKSSDYKEDRNYAEKNKNKNKNTRKQRNNSLTESSKSFINRTYYSTFQEDFTHFLSIQLFLTISLPPDFRVSERDLPLNFIGKKSCFDAYASIRVAIEGLKSSSTSRRRMSDNGGIMESSSFGSQELFDVSIGEDQKIKNNQNQNSNNNKNNNNNNDNNINNNNSNNENKTTDFSASSILSVLWSCIAIFANQNLPLGMTRTQIIPSILNTLTVAELTINKLHIQKSKERSLKEVKPKKNIFSFFSRGDGHAASDKHLTVDVDRHSYTERSPSLPSIPSASSNVPKEEKQIVLNAITNHRHFISYIINLLLSSSTGESCGIMQCSLCIPVWFCLLFSCHYHCCCLSLLLVLLY